MFNRFFKLGELSAGQIISMLFTVGFWLVLINSVLFGRYIYLTQTYYSSVRGADGWYTGVEVNNFPLAVLGGILSFILGLIVWKVVCELLLIIFRCLETYLEKNKV